MKTFILACLFVLTAVSGVAVPSDRAAAGHGKRAAGADVCSEGKTASGECVNAGLAVRMRQAAGGAG